MHHCSAKWKETQNLQFLGVIVIYHLSVFCDKRYLTISKVQTARANYSCTARNALGIDSATTVLSKWTLLCP